MVSGRTTGAKMAEQEDDFISLNPEKGGVSGRDAAEEGMEVYRAAQRERKKVYYSIIAAGLAFAVFCAIWVVDNLEDIGLVIFGVIVSFGGLARYVAVGMEKAHNKGESVSLLGRGGLFGKIVRVLILLGVPALIIWLYMQIGVK